MTTHLVADLHLGDDAVLEYTDRPFASVAEMDDALVDGWNRVVDDGDRVVFLGDLAEPSEPTTVRRWLRRLRGDVVFVAGDHDEGARRTRAVDVRRTYRLEAGGHELHCLHDPGDARSVLSTTDAPVDSTDAPVDSTDAPADSTDAPAGRSDLDGWLVHGHHHDLRPAEFPFVDPERRRVNVSVELLGYEPLPLEELVSYLDRGERLRRRPA